MNIKQYDDDVIDTKHSRVYDIHQHTDARCLPKRVSNIRTHTDASVRGEKKSSKGSSMGRYNDKGGVRDDDSNSVYVTKRVKRGGGTITVNTNVNIIELLNG